MLGSGDRVLCAGTVVAASIPERIDAAVAGGYRGISLWFPDLARAEGENLSLGDVRSMIADAGLELAEIDSVGSWLPGSEPPDDLDELSRSFLRTTDEALETAGALGARSVTANEMWGRPVDSDTAPEAFAALCDRAAEHGLLVHIEPMPMSGFRTVGDAWEVVRLADRPNGGILFDVWHHYRAGADDDLVRAVPGDRIFAVHLSDAPVEPARADVIEEMMHERLLPGLGAVDVVSKLRLLDEIGCRAPLGVEVISDELAALSPREAACRVASALDDVLDEARR